MRIGNGDPIASKFVAPLHLTQTGGWSLQLPDLTSG